jgi:S-DNA-T family DNA segregation ATPase FtsK/SpoIIIE
MLTRLTVRTEHGEKDFDINAPAGSTLDEVRSELGLGVDSAKRVYSGSVELKGHAALGGPGLRTGDLLELGLPTTREDVSRAVLRIHVVGGPDSGAIRALVRGRLVIGRDEGCDLTLTDPDVSRRHLALEVTASAVQVADLGSTNGTTLDGAPLGDDARSWTPGSTLRIGSTLLSLIDAGDKPAAMNTLAGVRVINRGPRQEHALLAAVIELPTRPSKPAVAKLQLVAAMVPALGGGVLALVMHNAQLLLFSLLTPLMMIGTSVGDRLSWRRHRRRDATRYRMQSEEIERELARQITKEVERRRSRHPDPAAVRRTTALPDHRLWERRRRDSDHLDVRLGVGTEPSTLLVREGADLHTAATLEDVPVSTSLLRGPLGICGPRSAVLPVARWAICQLAALQSPADVDFVFLLSAASAPDWKWARWLPHVAGIGIDDEQPSVTAAVQRAIDQRRAHGSASAWTGPWTILLLDRSSDLLGLPGLADLLELGPASGVSAICLDDLNARLPTECATIAQVSGETGSALRLSRPHEPSVDVLADQVTWTWAERLARDLASVQDAADEQSGSLPDSCRFLQLVDLEDPTPTAILSRWRLPADLRTAIGRSGDGVVHLDLVRDGPHALVAGTTGSGKSEFLQTLVAGLAVANSPLDLAFVLIDYKGGAAFSDCARLPHTAGLVTDLDAQLTERALQSLNAELRRREALFGLSKANDLEAYRNGHQHLHDPLGRLVLVVDEFAAMAEELPDFVPGLIAISQRGRSLGVHLVLATQRPGGVVSPEIKANTSLRVALRTTGPAESADVIGVDAAAKIDKSTPGRAFVRTGSVLNEVQIAHVGAPAIPARVGISVVPLDEWGRPTAEMVFDDGVTTDLTLLVNAIRETAAEAGIPTVRRPWLPPLRTSIPLSDLEPASSGVIATIGLVDEPTEQRQTSLRCDLEAGGTTVFIGGPGSGRTTILRTIAAGASARHGASHLHIYAVDCAGGALAGLRRLPHCGAAVTREHPASIARVLERLAADIAQRQDVLATLGSGSVADANRAGAALPAVLLFVDGWEGLTLASDEYDVGQSVETLLGIVRESASAGVSVFVTGGRAALTSRLSGLCDHRYVLRLPDPADYTYAGLSPRAVPVAMPPGRALRLPGAEQVQFAYCGNDPHPRSQWAEIDALAERWRGRGDEHGVADPGPWRVAALPQRVELVSLMPGRPRGKIVLGVGADDVKPMSVDLWASHAHWLVSGPPRSGRSNLLHCVLTQCIEQHRSVTVAAPKRSALATVAAGYGLDVITPDASAEQANGAMTGSTILLMDDSEEFLDTVAGEALRDRVSSAPVRELAVVVAGHTGDLTLSYRGLAALVKRSRTGILLQPSPGDAELFGIRLARARTPPIAGRGVLITDQLARGSTPIQLALVA